MRMLVAVMAMALSTGAAAQMFKCKDAAGKITYTSQACDNLGLDSAGEIKGKVSVSPALKSQPPKRTPAAQDAEPVPPKAEAPREKEPERRCFTVKTAKGTATRCNEVPGEDAK